MKDTLEGYLVALFPGATLTIERGENEYSISDVDDLRYLRKVNDVITGLIHLSKYVSEEY
jgi:hypothetical protein